MGVVETFELNLEPAEDSHGWTAMVYRSVRAGVCGPWTETREIPGIEGRMFIPVDELAELGLARLGLDREFAPGPVEAYGRYGRIALQVRLVRREQRRTA